MKVMLFQVATDQSSTNSDTNGRMTSVNETNSATNQIDLLDPIHTRFRRSCLRGF